MSRDVFDAVNLVLERVERRIVSVSIADRI